MTESEMNIVPKALPMGVRLGGFQEYKCSCGKELAAYGKDFILLEVSGNTCPSCGKPVYAWEYMLECLDKNPMPELMNSILDFANFKAIIGQLFIKPFEVISLDFQKIGIPKNALILDVVYSTEYQHKSYYVCPQEMHGAIPNKKFVPHRIQLYGCVLDLNQKKYKSGTHGSDVSNIDTSIPIRIDYQVKYVENSDYDLGMNYLNKAAKAFHESEIEQSILNAAIASEISVSSVCMVFWKKHFKAKKAKNLSKEETLMNKLNYHLKLASDEANLELPKKEIRKALSDLASRRNEIMHLGHLPKGIKLEEFNRLIASAFFIKSYCDILIKSL